MLAGMVAAAVALGALTWRQAEVWRDPTSLWTHALAIHPSAIAHYNLAVVIFGRGQLADAVSHFHRALATKPDYAEAHYNLALVLVRQGRQSDAVEHLRRARSIKPGLREAQENLDQLLAGGPSPR